MTEVKLPAEEQEPPPPVHSSLRYSMRAAKRLSTGKSPGLDRIPAEPVKATGTFLQIFCC